jgi:Zn finger protein HypA/HybF involved in hydrogenase expression
VVAEIFAGMSAIKSAFDIAKGPKDIDDATRRNAAVIDLQEKILAAQEAQATLIETVRELKARVASLETWETEKQRYELKDVGEGSLAYVTKEAMRGGEPPHQICARCFEHGRKSILQPNSRNWIRLLFCPECKTELRIGFETPTIA